MDALLSLAPPAIVGVYQGVMVLLTGLAAWDSVECILPMLHGDGAGCGGRGEWQRQTLTETEKTIILAG